MSFIVNIFAVFDYNNTNMSGNNDDNKRRDRTHQRHSHRRTKSRSKSSFQTKSKSKGDRVKRISLRHRNDNDNDNDNAPRGQLFHFGPDDDNHNDTNITTNIHDNDNDNDSNRNNNNTNVRPRPIFSLLSNTEEPADIDIDAAIKQEIKEYKVDEDQWHCGTKGHAATSKDKAFCSEDKCDICQWRELNITPQNDPFPVSEYEWLMVNERIHPNRLGHHNHPYNVLPHCYHCGFPTRCTDKFDEFQGLYKCPKCLLVQFIWDYKGQYFFNDWVSEVNQKIVHGYREFVDKNPDQDLDPWWDHYIGRNEKLLKEYTKLGATLGEFLSAYKLANKSNNNNNNDEQKSDGIKSLHAMFGNPETIKKFAKETNNPFVKALINCAEDFEEFSKILNKKSNEFTIICNQCGFPKLPEQIQAFFEMISNERFLWNSILNYPLTFATYLAIMDPTDADHNHLFGGAHIDSLLMGNLSLNLCFSGSYRFGFPGTSTWTKIKGDEGYVMNGTSSAMHPHRFQNQEYSGSDSIRIIGCWYNDLAYRLLHEFALYFQDSFTKELIQYCWITNNNNNNNNNNNRKKQYTQISTKELKTMTLEDIQYLIQHDAIAAVQPNEMLVIYKFMHDSIYIDEDDEDDEDETISALQHWLPGILKERDINAILTKLNLSSIPQDEDGVMENPWTWKKANKFEKMISAKIGVHNWARLQLECCEMRIKKYPWEQLQTAFNESSAKLSVCIDYDTKEFKTITKFDQQAIQILQQKKKAIENRQRNDDNNDIMMDDDDDDDDDGDDMEESSSDDDDDEPYDQHATLLQAAKGRLASAGLGRYADILEDNDLMVDWETKWLVLNQRKLIELGFDTLDARKFVKMVEKDF